MRWENLTDSDHARAADPALFGADAVTTRTVDTPEVLSSTHHRRT
ncbi:hypothetical protein SAM23877_6185 [Streptomyces ambofaciens ATCC 23877]|uniref:Uncharacterized protein n=1 Tax=Streptomyces ambofaciens (strain ATCC 23877 / 3486 / DSM 40053 / JCM 4204 / NBRC 12836 / NRRL B-2516) TaxID=278992 RepID=A0A0K2B1H2_STRA7|nr:hypothetical protein [Streptomyces ambofaciens]AKZ59230.1 hypothetical protein SAM23877_6185 [Streptomyces ambofaciens ATCC 23877]